jgi:hypothetical protein
MTDESRFRSHRGHGQTQQTGSGSHTRRGEDPLAELARLIGQEDPFADFTATRAAKARASGNGNDPRNFRRPSERALDGGHDDRAPARQRPAEPARVPHEAYGGDYDDRAPARRRPAEPARVPHEADGSDDDPRYAESPRSNGRSAYAYRSGREMRDEAAARDDYARPAKARGPIDEVDEESYVPLRAERPQTYVEQDQEEDAYSDHRDMRRGNDGQGYAESSHDRYQEYDYDPDYTKDAYLPAHGQDVYEDAPRRHRRNWLVLSVALVGIAVIGVSGVFAYRALFGVNHRGLQPKMIKSETAPSKVLPGAGTQTAEASGQKLIYDRIGSDRPPAGERIVSREETLMDAAANRASAPAAPSSTQASPAATGSAPFAAAIEPKRVRTITVRADGTVVANQAAAASRIATTGSTQRSAAAGSSQPLALNTYSPSAQAAPEPAASTTQSNRSSRTAATPAQNDNPWGGIPSETRPAPAPAAQSNAPAQVASLPAAPRAPAPTIAVQAPPPAGSYVVQVSSQKSEADAQSSWQQLQAKHASILGGQQASIRKVDLGDRGTFYRAQLGPYRTRNQATEICQSLKAAGGDCVVQRH